MKYFLVIVSLIVCVSGAPHTGRVFGGQNATAGQFPFMVVINDYEDQHCNGVILTPSWILTTAECLFDLSPFAEVYVGSHVNLENGTGYRLFEKVFHKEYESNSLLNNIGLIRINAVLEYGDTIQPIALSAADPAPTTTCTLMGWGVSDWETFPPLQYIDLPIIDLETCRNASGDSLGDHYLGPEEFCTLGALEQGACWGDAGGALVCDGALAGILSYGVEYDDQCAIGFPEIYLSMATYADWIQSYIG